MTQRLQPRQSAPQVPASSAQRPKPPQDSPASTLDVGGRQAQPERLVMTIEELATALDISVRTIRYRLAAGAFPIPPITGLDKKLRWSREVVRAWVNRPAHGQRLRRTG